MRSNYLTSADSSGPIRRATVKIVSLFLALFVLVSLAAFSAMGLAPEEETAAAADPVQWLACFFGPDSKPDLLYQSTQGSTIQFALFSRSYVGSPADDVRSGLNGILNYVMTQGEEDSPYSFEAVNERIIGQKFDGSLPMDDDAYKRWNKGQKVNPYNRFGVAGLTFSNYAGEWKHLFIDACETDDEPEARYDTGASTNVVRVASWNVCSTKAYCNTPDFPNPKTGQPFTKAEIWDDFADRMALAKTREMTAIAPDVLLAQEVKDEGDGSTKIFYETLCSDLKPGFSGSSAQTICYNGDKFRAVTNEEFNNAQGSKRFAGTPVGGAGGYTWMILEDQSLRRSVFVSAHLQAHSGSDGIRQAQAEFITKDLQNRFAGSFYPIVVGGDWNSHDPESCDRIGELGSDRDGGARALCAAGFEPANSLATSRVDLEKASFQGFTPWSSKDGPHLDHIWVNSYVGVGEARVYAPAGRASSDHAMVSATLNLNGLSVAQPGDPQDPQTNKFYNTRIEPRSTWEDISTSEDVRTLQFSAGFDSRFGGAIVNNLTNWIFTLTKFIVVFTIAFIGFAFADVGRMTKLTEIVAGNGGSDPGVFGRLHEGVFQPLVILAMLATAVYLFYTAIVKRQIRSGLGGLFRSLACFLAAIVISVSPAWFIALPNNVALVSQALIVSQLDEGLAGGNGLCDSNLDAAPSITDGASSPDADDPEAAGDFLERVSVNMQSGTGCMLWYNLLLRPWAEGQFGSEYTELYGTLNGDCSTQGTNNTSFNVEHTCLGDDKKEGQNRNFEWVGDPIVPLGGGNCTSGNNCDSKLESNWALLQISTQTNAHAPILPPEDRGRTSRYSQGVAIDWWRVVDAMSNYHEERVPLDVCDAGEGCAANGEGVETPPYPQALPTDVMEEWDDWVGGNQGSRLWTIMASFLIALFGVAAPLVFSALATIYAIGVTILMALAPIFLLFGCWAGKGWELFKAWADLVINTTMKRIAVGLLVVLSIAVTSGLLNQMEELGLFKTLLLIVLLSFALIKARSKIFAAVSFARFSNTDLSGTANRFTGMLQKGGSAAGNLAIGAAAGGTRSAMRGESFKGGALAGFKHQADNLTYQSRLLRSVKIGMDMTGERSTRFHNELCVICDYPLQDGDAYGRVNGPKLYGMAHSECVENEKAYYDFDEYGVIEAKKEVHSSYNSHKASIELLGEGLLPAHEAMGHLEKLVTTITEEVERVQTERKIRDRTGSKNKNTSPAPPLPDELKPYVDERAILLAWQEEEYEYVKLAYTAGWIAYAEQNGDWGPDGITQSKKLELLSRVQSSSD